MRPLTIATGMTSGENILHWRQREITWPKFVRALEKPAGSKSQAMSYVFGSLRYGPTKSCSCIEEYHRNKSTVVSRDAVVLDADYVGIEGDSLRSDVAGLGFTAVAHTTWSSKPLDERLRLVFPVSEPLAPAEYGPIARWLMTSLGSHLFDHTCDQYSRLMYLPSAPEPAEYRTWEWAGSGWLDSGFILDLAGGPEVAVEYDPPKPRTPGTPTTRAEALQVGCLYDKVIGAEEGSRNNTLFKALKQGVDLGLDLDLLAGVLEEAAMAVGLGSDEIATCIKGALG